MDILFLGLAAIVWMFLEARRLSMRGIWLHVLASVFIAISIAFPIFFTNRERMRARRDGSAATGAWSATDTSGLGLPAVPMPGYTFASRAGQAGHSLRPGVGVVVRGRVTRIFGFR